MEKSKVLSKLKFFESLNSSERQETLFTELQSAFQTSKQPKLNHVLTLLGASGNLAKKKIYPTLWWLYRDDLLPENTYFLGYARSNLDIKEFLTKTAYTHMKVKPEEKEKFAEFVAKNYFLVGNYDNKVN